MTANGADGEVYPMNAAQRDYSSGARTHYDYARDSYDSQARISMDPRERQSITDEYGWDLPEESDSGCLRALCAPFAYCLRCFSKGNVNGCGF
ncbi:unnamed protein product [Sympodiomycopsis kandeliae]